MMRTLLDHDFESDTAQLETVRRHVRETLSAYGCDDEFTETSVLAVDEAVSNVMRHGYAPGERGALSLVIAVDGGDMLFRVRDFAKRFDPRTLTLPQSGELRAGGYGRLLIDHIMDTVEYGDVRDGHGNLLEMRRKLQPATPQRQEQDRRGNQ